MRMDNILIINYDLNNITSISNVLKKIGHNPIISSDPSKLRSAAKIILPGVGSFDSAIKILENYGWKDRLREFVEKYEIPLLGICLGMQLLAESSDEGSPIEGLGLIKGNIKKLEKNNSNEKVPHIGWNEVNQKKESIIFQNIPNNTDFYFVHSYHYKINNHEEVLGETPYCGNFVSVINKSNIFGVQFHPEKSAKYGIQLLKNFININ